MSTYSQLHWDQHQLSPTTSFPFHLTIHSALSLAVKGLYSSPTTPLTSNISFGISGMFLYQQPSIGQPKNITTWSTRYHTHSFDKHPNYTATVPRVSQFPGDVNHSHKLPFHTLHYTSNTSYLSLLRLRS
ncbi:hypothetical protein AWRI3579_g243 [Hanseniaspora osmophila]|uniref:Uncharacterized protein n=1 Tax=Hanseniaspora osmophila TaxID=56408 RepID=A0A1E5RZX4_9ASCO|nr:hypothetical protein AWRI3579_g243 [Hanseniaspora osmophila]